MVVDPILSTGLATDWLKRLHKLWSTLRRTRADELQEIRNVFGDPELLARFYIEPDCQPVNPADHDEDESIRAFRQSVRPWLNRFLEREFFERDGRNTVFILSDAGMGKSSLLMMLKLTHLLRFWPDGLDFRLLKLGPDTLEKLASIQNRNKTILLLDSLDEDSSAWGRIEERLMEILKAAQSFRQVILTCRTQFFPEGSAAPIEAQFKVVVQNYICNLLYLSPFDNEQVNAYLGKVYPNHLRDLPRKLWKKEDNPKLLKARKVVQPMKSLRMRPMLLAHIDDLLQSDVHEWREFPVYSVLVRRWLLRELRKQQGKYTEDQLWELCEEVAIFLQMFGRRILTLADLEAIRKRLPAAETLEAFDIGGRSLLNRTSDKGFRFSHYSVQEFLVARRLVSGAWKETSSPIRGTDQLLSFLFSWIDESPIRRLAGVPWRSMDFKDVRFRVDRNFDAIWQEGWTFAQENIIYDLADLNGARLQGIYLRGARFSGSLVGADLRDAWLEDAVLTRVNLAGADLRRAHLKGCVLHGVDLQGVDAREADFSNCSFLNDTNLSRGRFARTNFEGADLVSAVIKGAGFLAAEGLDVQLLFEQSAGLPSPLVLMPMLFIDNVESGTQLMVESTVDSVKIRACGNFASSLKLPRTLAWVPGRSVISFGSFSKEVGRGASSGRLSLSESCLDSIRSLAWTAGGENLFLVGANGNVEQWDMTGPQYLRVKKRLGDALAVGCYDREGTLLAVCPGHQISANDQGSVAEPFQIRILNFQTDEQIEELTGHGYRANCLAWKPDSPVLASAATDCTVYLWDLKLRQVETLESPLAVPASLAWNSTGTLLAAILNDGSLCVWNVNRQARFSFQEALPPAANLAWTDRATQIALLSQAGEVILLDVFNEHQIRLPVRAKAIACHPRAHLLALSTPLGAIEVWDFDEDTPKWLLSLFDTPPIQGLVITVDGYVDGPPEALEYVRFADGLALYDLTDLPERHDPERIRQTMAILST